MIFDFPLVSNQYLPVKLSDIVAVTPVIEDFNVYAFEIIFKSNSIRIEYPMKAFETCREILCKHREQLIEAWKKFFNPIPEYVTCFMCNSKIERNSDTWYPVPLSSGRMGYLCETCSTKGDRR